MTTLFPPIPEEIDTLDEIIEEVWGDLNSEDIIITEIEDLEYEG